MKLSHGKITLIGIGCLLWLETLALLLGVDGIALSLALLLIGGFCGYNVEKLLTFFRKGVAGVDGITNREKRKSDEKK